MMSDDNNNLLQMYSKVIDELMICAKKHKNCTVRDFLINLDLDDEKKEVVNFAGSPKSDYQNVYRDTS